MSNIKYRFYKYINLYVHVCVYTYIYNVYVCVSRLNHNLVSYLDVISAEFCAFWVRKSRENHGFASQIIFICGILQILPEKQMLAGKNRRYLDTVVRRMTRKKG